MSDIQKEEKNWEELSYDEKNEQLYQNEKQLLEMFRTRGAISQWQYEKSLHDLIEKTGHSE
ncbi:MAG: hypothetical protein Q4D71_05440 [Oscillospiraceae bacterium]|nr:hypothetical protein [Oscillospiraceae bacterium]